ncbi:hypothetical protein GCM10010862_31160 [Devosia nitrariae]|uniref:Uncharacterized protein n=1 Tax=Devosia nitrariae TaxID=2071872 RepID=A0ABQ5W7B1_9HYPH|nr:hypothetical protein GCM10010862_31160 [Devosia nitrariae]
MRDLAALDAHETAGKIGNALAAQNGLDRRHLGEHCRLICKVGDFAPAVTSIAKDELEKEPRGLRRNRDPMNDQTL